MVTPRATPARRSMLDALISSPMRDGTLTWIGLRPARREPLVAVTTADLIAARGVAEDHYRTNNDGARQVTLIAAEDLAAIAAFLGRDSVAPELLRRNLVTSGINLIALKGRRFRIGNALLEGSGECAPCSRMEQNLGAGGYNAVRGHGGITARVLEGAVIAIGDAIVPEPLADESD